MNFKKICISYNKIWKPEMECFEFHSSPKEAIITHKSNTSIKILCRKRKIMVDYHLFSAKPRNWTDGRLTTTVILIAALTFSYFRQRIAQFKRGFIIQKNSCTTCAWWYIFEEIKRYDDKSQCPIIWKFLQYVQNVWITNGMFGSSSGRLGFGSFYSVSSHQSLPLDNCFGFFFHLISYKPAS